MNEVDINQRRVAYWQACRKGTDWLLDGMNSDGSCGPAEERLYYYRLPWALSLMGEIIAANQVLDWISRQMFTANGAFAGVSPQGIFESRYGSYPLACLLVGATMLQRFDLVYPGGRQLLSWQDPQTGGFGNSPWKSETAGEQDLFPACQAGMTLLLLGQLEAARKAGEWVKRLWELQPDVKHKLFAVYHPEKGLVTDYPPDQAAMYVTMKDEPWQHHFNGGITAAFLTELFLATGESEWLALAREYQKFSMTTDACQFQSMQTCKSGWGSGLLYVATREKRYRDWTLRLGDWFVEHQHADGHWENTKYWTPDPTQSDKIEVTTEFVMHLANILAYVALDVSGIIAR